jgi:hypothetical protein
MDISKFNSAVTDLADTVLHPRVSTDNFGNSKPKYKRSEMIVDSILCHSGDSFAVGKTAANLYVAFFGGNAYVAADRAELDSVLNHIERGLLPAE